MIIFVVGILVLVLTTIAASSISAKLEVVPENSRVLDAWGARYQGLAADYFENE